MKEHFFDERRGMHKWKFALIPVGIAAFLALCSFIVMQLWNHLVPDIFHLGMITFWQAFGLFILCKILFGFGKGGPWGRGKAPWMKHRIAERFRHMTPEQKERFREHMRKNRCNYRDWDNFDWEGDDAAEKGTSAANE